MTDESGDENPQCVFCEEEVEPTNRLAKRYICRTCLLETQVGQRV